MSDEGNIIIVENLTKTYGTKVKTDVLKKVNLKIKTGSFNWIVGSSGSGKTTLLNLISGLDSATSGNIFINNNLITNMNDKEKALFRSKYLGFIFQFHYLLPEFTALENVLMPLRIQKQKINKNTKQKAIDLLQLVGLGHVYNHYPKEMSGGEQQRTAIARAIIGNPKLIIADEPTGNLDSNNAKQVYDLIRKLHKDYKMTFIIVTHDNINPEKGDRLITLKDGLIISDEVY